jgi:pimeloyl-ACP methyl ester carboxylesterase
MNLHLPLHDCTLADGETLRYRIHGAGPSKLLLVHGLAARAETWIDLVPLFPADRYTVYLLDLLGSGESAKPHRADYSIRAHGERLLRLIERNIPEGVTLVGHSLGGSIALMAAIEAASTARCDLIRSLVVIGGPGFIQRLPLIARVFRYPLTGPLFVLLPAPEEWVRMGLRMAYYDHRLVDRVHVARYLPCYRERDAKRALVATCRSIVPPDAAEITGRYGILNLPILLLWGREDRIVPLSHGIRLEAAIPGARLEILEQCGHNPQEEKPEDTYRIIDSFACSPA